MNWIINKFSRVSRSASGCLPVMIFALAGGLFQGPAGATGLADGCLWGGEWAVATWGFQSRGYFSLIVTDIALRLEISELSEVMSPAVGLQLLWEQDGTGWTLVTDRKSVGTTNAWGREWRKLEPARRDLLTHLAEALPSLTSERQTNRPGRVTFILDSAEEDEPSSPFRRNLVARGWGQGGPGEIVTLRSVSSGVATAGALTLALTSSRRPGTLTITFKWPGISLEEVPPELFAPLWPLENFLDFPEQDPELPGPGGVE